MSPPVGFNLFVLQTMSGKDTNYGRARGVAVLLPAGGRGVHHHGISADRDGPAEGWRFPTERCNQEGAIR